MITHRGRVASLAKLATMTLKLGIVGFGEAGRLHALHAPSAGAQVVGVVSRRPLPPGVARFEDLESLLPHVDAVSIAFPNSWHASLALVAMRAGKPVLVEKPLALHQRELDALDDAFARAPVPVLVGFRLRFNPRLRALKENLSGVKRIACAYRLGIADLARGKDWTRREAESGGSFFTLGVHALDLARWLAGGRGEPLEELQAEADHHSSAADFPLRVSITGRLGGIRLEAEADLRDRGSPFRLEVEIDGDAGKRFREQEGDPAPEDEKAADAEYGSMLAEFVRRARSQEVDRVGWKEIVEEHRELARARELVRGC